MNCKSLIPLLSILFLSYSVSYATVSDSIGMIEQNGKRMILHMVGKETLYSIAKKYSVTVDDIKANNPEVEKGLKLGQKILIPYSPPVPLPSSDNYILHKVEQGQTLYAISKKYNTPVDDIKRWNNLATNDMKVGSIVIVGEKTSAKPKPEVPPVVPAQEYKPASKQESKAGTQKQTEKSASGYEKNIEKGNAEFFETTDGNTFYYAQHRTISNGTIIKVMNESNGTAVYAKVIGKIPSGTDPNTIIKLTKVAMDRLQVEKGSKIVVEYVP